MEEHFLLFVLMHLISVSFFFCLSFFLVSVSATISLSCNEDIDQSNLETSWQPSEDEEAKTDSFINYGDPAEDSDSKADSST